MNIQQLGSRYFIWDQATRKYLHKSGELRTMACSGQLSLEPTGWYNSRGEAEEAIALHEAIAGRATLQTIYDRAWQAFIIEDRPPATIFDEGWETCCCRYLTPDGRRCAVGLCIPDSSPLVDTKASFCGLIYADRREFDRLFYVPGLDDTLLVNFQKSLHDDLIDRKNAGEWGYNREERAAKYREVAEKFGLEQHR